ncbi:AAA family ATPase [Maledivibacter halophilus]|uniref:Adenylate kinase n=1 Tax=Maledivibacter halophilus TaxID=36842 RepID=A0A1T5M141_9FIRM|nr:AAA family ATPase [Maledivibacter halophilus]SKC81962.1 Adenylate kinase [Maledivibacter halophilus]
MKKFILVTGAPGVGKTTLCKELFKSINGCAWLDSDWCWMIHPWIPKTTEQKKYVEGSFLRVLRGYLENEDIHTVLFSWVMNSMWMFDLITEPLSDLTLDIRKIALVCAKEQHMKRMKLDGRRDEQANFPDSMDNYYKLGASIIDVTSLSKNEAAKIALNIIEM